MAFSMWAKRYLYIDTGPIPDMLHTRSTHLHDDVIKWKHFPRYWPSVRGIHRSQVNSPHKGQWRRALMFSLICAWMNDWVNNHEAGDLRRHCAHYDVTVVSCPTHLNVLWCQWRTAVVISTQHDVISSPQHNFVFYKCILLVSWSVV